MNLRPLLLVPAFVALLLVPAFAEPPVEAPAAPPEQVEGPSDAERAEVKAMVAELRAEAATIRGLEWKFEVEADLLSRDQLRANMVKMVKEEMKPEELERDTRILRRIGLLAEDQDPLEMALEMMGEMVAGYYNPKTKKLYLIQGLVGEGQRPVVLHELIHALEDQYLDLEKLLKAHENDSDRTFAAQCIGEGSAEHARELFQAANPGLTEAYMKAQQNPEMMKAQLKVLRTIPAFMIVPTLLHYDLGPKLVGKVVGDDYPGGIASLYEDGPVSQEQFLHPEKWTAENQDFPQKIVFPDDLAKAAGEGWSKLHETTGGELDLIMYLDYFLGGSDGKLNLMRMMAQGTFWAKKSATAAAGWDGSQGLCLEHEGKSLLLIDAHAFDTPDDAREAANAMLEALKVRNGSDFVGGDWDTGSLGASPELWVADYIGIHGPGRIAIDGTKVFLVDGASHDVIARVWPRLLETRFERNPRDTWTPSEVEPSAALEGLDVANEDAGVGLKLPDGWSEGQADQDTAVFAVEKDDVQGMLMRQPMPGTVPLEMILPMLEKQFQAQFPDMDPADRKSVTLAGQPGYRYRLGEQKGVPDLGSTVMYIGLVPKGLAIFTFHGPEEAIVKLLEEMDAIVEGAVFLEAE